MSVTLDDVRHVASLARLGLTDERAHALVGELNTILRHMDVLSSIDTSRVEDTGHPQAKGHPERSEGSPSAVRPDAGPPILLARNREDLAPQMRDGFYLVPRLATHEDAEASS